MSPFKLYCCVLVTFELVAARASAVEYTFVNIADTRGPFDGIASITQAVSETGTVAFIGYQSGVGATYIGDGTTTHLVANLTEPPGFQVLGGYKLNGSGIAAASAARSAPEEYRILHFADATSRTIAQLPRDHTQDLLWPPAINNSGMVAFAQSENVPGGLRSSVVHWSDGRAVTLFETTTPSSNWTYLGDVGINERGDVAFHLLELEPETGDIVGNAIYRTDGNPPVRIADSHGALAIRSSFEPIAINDQGTVAFWAQLDAGGEGVFMGDGGPLKTIALADQTTAFREFNEHVQINDAGEVAIRGQLWDGTSGIYTGPDRVADKVIEIGDRLFGQRVSLLGNPFLNNRGDIAFWYAVLDATGERTGIALALREQPLAGDYNGNGRVEQADLDLVLLNWGAQTPPIPAIWTNDLPSGLIDQQELDRVLLHWGSGVAIAAAAAIPEPRAILLALVAICLACCLRRSARWRR